MVDIQKINQNGITIVVVIGEVDASSSIDLDSAMNETIASGALKIIVDCENLDYISSAGLGVFMSYIEEIKANNAKMIITGLNEKVFNVFKILGLDQLLETADTRDQAIELLK